MAIESAQIAVSTTATELTNTAARISGDSTSILVQAPAGAVLYVGPAGVTTANGFPVPAGSSFSIDLEFGERLYGVLASGTATAFVLRQGV